MLWFDCTHPWRGTLQRGEGRSASSLNLFSVFIFLVTGLLLSFWNCELKQGIMFTSLGAKISSLKEERYKYTMKEVRACLAKFAGISVWAHLVLPLKSCICWAWPLKRQKHWATQGQRAPLGSSLQSLPGEMAELRAGVRRGHGGQGASSHQRAGSFRWLLVLRGSCHYTRASRQWWTGRGHHPMRF